MSTRTSRFMVPMHGRRAEGLSLNLNVEYVYRLVAARATERGLQSAGVLVSEGPVAILPRLSAASLAGLLRSVEALARILRRVEALEFCGRVCAVLTSLRDKSRAPAAILVGTLNTYAFLECGGKRSATPLWIPQAWHA
jgi:hypothetical protein